MKDLECQDIKAVLNSATENYSRFLSKLHFKKCYLKVVYYKTAEEARRQQHQVFLLLQNLRQEAIRVCIRMKSIQNKHRRDARDVPRLSNGADLREALPRGSHIPLKF